MKSRFQILSFDVSPVIKAVLLAAACDREGDVGGRSKRSLPWPSVK